MCGIICEIIYSGISKVKNTEQVLEYIKNRGPDCFQSLELQASSSVQIFFSGTVLWMQGTQLTPQPVDTEEGVLLYNGDIFDETWDKTVSDTKVIMDKLTHAMSTSSEKIVEVLQSFKGPFSIILYLKKTCELFFTRDRIGRNSLLFHGDEKSVIISSVLDKSFECIEIPALHIYKLNLDSNIITTYKWSGTKSNEISLHDWLLEMKKQQSMSDDEFAFECISFGEPNIDIETNLLLYMDAAAQKTKNKLEILMELSVHNYIKQTVKDIINLLEKSVKIRLETQPNKCKKCLKSNITICNHCSVGVLFSGGLDCTILAFLVDKYVPKEQSIDLINVAFQKGNMSYEVPDRITGKQSFEEIKNRCPSRSWTFTEINVTQTEKEKHQKASIGHLVYPRQTVLDESLGSALWFAARGKDNERTSPCRILILGSGADELFGGYTRHRNAYKRGGWPRLSRELQLDWQRISLRNLARDNRVICDHGRQPRMPYLDENFTDYVLNLKPWMKCYPNEKFGPGIGDKLMLRLVAFNLGLTQVATLPKRALQFGSRIANKKDKGSDLSKNLMYQIK